jgi:hypothetical protein
VHLFPLRLMVVAVLGSSALFAGPAFGLQTTAHTTSTSSSGLANLPVVKATMSCAELANTTSSVDGLAVKIVSYQVGSAAAGDPQYCALTGHIANYIGFEILLPTTTWRQRYLQVGCGGLCGMIGINAPESSGYAALGKGYFVVAADDEGHSGSSDSWYGNPTQRVDFAYLSEHDLAVVAKGLAARFYHAKPKYSYFDGCSQGGHEALTEVQRYPQDFNGVLAGAPASIMTELNAVLHEWTADADISSSGHPIVTESEADLVTAAALKACDPKVGLMLDYLACEQTFKLSSLLCRKGETSGCLTSAQLTTMAEIYEGPVTGQGQKLYPGGYPLGSEWGLGLPTTTTAAVPKGGPFSAWLEYFAFEKDIGVTGIDDEQFTKAYFDKIEQLAPFWDATDPDLAPFEQAGGKLILWQGEADWSIPTISSIAYYQAVVNAMGGLASTTQFARYYLLPSAGHCGSGGPGAFGGLAAVVSWTETGQAPTTLTATEYSSNVMGGPPPGGPPPGGSGSDLTDAIPVLGAPTAGTVVRSISVFPYPELPAYRGHGSVDDASSFIGEVSTALQEPVQWLGNFNTTVMWCNSGGTDCRLT